MKTKPPASQVRSDLYCFATMYSGIGTHKQRNYSKRGGKDHGSNSKFHLHRLCGGSLLVLNPSEHLFVFDPRCLERLRELGLKRSMSHTWGPVNESDAISRDVGLPPQKREKKNIASQHPKHSILRYTTLIKRRHPYIGKE